MLKDRLVHNYKTKVRKNRGPITNFQRLWIGLSGLPSQAGLHQTYLETISSQGRMFSKLLVTWVSGQRTSMKLCVCY